MAQHMVASLRLRLLLLIGLVLVPALLLAAFRYVETTRQLRERADEDARRLVQIVTLEQERVLDSTRLLLTGLAQVPTIRAGTAAACDQLLADLLAHTPRFGNLGRVDAAGNLNCSATPIPQPVNLADREWFQRARDSGVFARGEYQIGRVTGQPTLVSAQPIFTAEGRFDGAVYAGLALNWLNDFLAAADLPPGATVLIVDSQGTVLARYPDSAAWLGRQAADAPLLQAMLAQRQGTVLGAGLDGVQRVYAFMPLQAGVATELVSVGLPEAATVVETRLALARDLIAALATGCLAMGLGMVGAERLVLRRVRLLTRAVARLRSGDLEARTGLADQGDELGRLAATFDAMAAGLAARERELREARDRLEERVGDRTRDLAAVNERLERELAERRRAEDALTRLTELHELILNSTAEGIYGLDRTGRPMFVNQAAARLMGYPVGALVAHTDLHALLHHDGAPPAAAGRAECPVCAADATQQAQSSDRVQLRRQDGSSLPVELTCTPMRAGEAVVGSVVTFRDVSARQEAAAALNAQWSYLKRLIDAIPNPIYAMDADGRYSLVNRALAELYGCKPSAVLGKTLADFYDDPALVARLETENREVLVSHQARFTAPRRVRAPGSGELRWREAIKVPIAGPDGAGQQVLCIVIDVTDHQQALEALKRSEAQLIQAQKMEAVGRLAGGIAHDFNNLLTVILSCAEILQLQLAPEDALREFADDSAEAAERAADLTRQLLAFSRQQVLAPEVLDLGGVVAEADKLLRRLIGEDIELVTVLRPGLGRVRADPAQLQQVILNLAVNARDAMPGGGTLTIEMANILLDEPVGGDAEALPAGDYVMLAVTDTGAGMSRETQAHIFEPFYTTKGPGEGTGLGLSTVYGIVKQSGGEIRVYSEQGHGTTFKIYLPRVLATLEAETTPQGSPLLVPGHGTVLLVEDETNVRQVAARALESCGYELLVAATPAEALALLREYAGPLDLLITDVIMPGMTGRELAAHILADRPHLPVLYMSGYPDRAMGDSGIISPELAFLQKPFTPSLLTRRVRDLLVSLEAAS